jgi:hypothetical protein
MKSSAVILALTAAITMAKPHGAIAGPNGIDVIKIYELNRRHSIAVHTNANLDVNSTGSINGIRYRENTNRRGRDRQ